MKRTTPSKSSCATASRKSASRVSLSLFTQVPMPERGGLWRRGKEGVGVLEGAVEEESDIPWEKDDDEYEE